MTADIRLLRWAERDRDEYERLAAALMRVREAAAQARGDLVATVPAGPEEPSDLERARAIFAHRRARDAAAGGLADIFGEPAWDLLLATYIAYEEGRALHLSAAAATAAIRPLVAERWLAVLRQRRLLHPAGEGTSGDAPLSLTAAGMALVLRCVGQA